MNKQDYYYFKQQLKQGNRITLIYNKTASTGEIATTHSDFKTFKYDVKRLCKEGIRFSVRVERNKYKIIQEIYSIVKEINESADLIGEDTIWHDYVERLNNKLFDLTFYI